MKRANGTLNNECTILLVSGIVSDLKYRFAHSLKTTILVLNKCFQLERLEPIFAQGYLIKTFLLLLKKLFYGLL